MSNCEISLVIPVYNGAKYIAQTLDSVLSQTFRSFEVVCVNDCSTDNSLEILLEYANRDSRVRVFSTPCNLGIVPRVINHILPSLNGAYYVYASQDDLFSTDWLEAMYHRAKETDADATIPDLVFFFENQPERCRKLSGVHGRKDIVLTKEEAVEYSLDWTIPGNALWRMSLIKQVGFFDFGMNADEYSIRVHFWNCSKVCFSDGVFYYRQCNPDAITKKISVKSFDLPQTDFFLWKFLKDNNFPETTQRKLLKRSLYGLIKWKIESYSIDHELQNEADKKLANVFYLLKSAGVRKLLLENPSPKNLISLAAFSLNFRFFSYVLFPCFLLLQWTKSEKLSAYSR